MCFFTTACVQCNFKSISILIFSYRTLCIISISRISSPYIVTSSSRCPGVHCPKNFQVFDLSLLPKVWSSKVFSSHFCHLSQPNLPQKQGEWTWKRYCWFRQLTMTHVFRKLHWPLFKRWFLNGKWLKHTQLGSFYSVYLIEYQIHSV